MCHPCPGCAQAPGSPCTHSTSLPGASNHKTSFLTFLPQAYFPQQAFLAKAASPSLTRCIGGSRAGRGHKRVCLAARSWPEVMIQGLTLPAPPPLRAEAAPPRMAHPITSTPTCPGWSAACLQQLNFAKMVKPVSINPDPNRVFFMTEATA